MGTLYSGLRTTLSNILKNKQTFLLSVATITISIFILGLFLILFFNLNGILLKLNNQVQLIAYLSDDITPSQKSNLQFIKFSSNNKDELEHNNFTEIMAQRREKETTR